MRRDCPCYELTDGCGCQCCYPTIGEVMQRQLPSCVDSSEHDGTPCECHSIEYLMRLADIDPQLARSGGYSYTSAEAFSIKQGRREAY